MNFHEMFTNNSYKSIYTYLSMDDVTSFRQRRPKKIILFGIFISLTSNSNIKQIYKKKNIKFFKFHFIQLKYLKTLCTNCKKKLKKIYFLFFKSKLNWRFFHTGLAKLFSESLFFWIYKGWSKSNVTLCTTLIMGAVLYKMIY